MALNPTTRGGAGPRCGGAGTTPDREGDLVVRAVAIQQGFLPTETTTSSRESPMTAEPTTRITPPQFAQDPTFGAPQPPAYPQGHGPAFPPPPAAPLRNTGRIVGVVAGLVVLLGALAAGALILFGPRTVDPASAH